MAYDVSDQLGNDEQSLQVATNPFDNHWRPEHPE